MNNIYIKVGVIVENENKEILLLKEKVDEESPLAWNIIKGTYEDIIDEKIVDCAIRECKEESGLDVEIIGVQKIMFFHKKDKLKIQINFIAKPLNDLVSLPHERNIDIEGENIQLLKWMKPEDIKLLKTEDFVAGYTLSILLDWIENRKIVFLDILNEY